MSEECLYFNSGLPVLLFLAWKFMLGAVMRIFFLVGFMLFFCGSSYAALGAAPSDFKTAHGSRKSQALSAVVSKNFQISETTLPSGTLVREYISAKGVVFAVSWSGPLLPDLQTLLGKHFKTMVDEAGRAPKAGHSQLRVSRPEVSIFSGGHMRAYEGKAWVSSEFPEGFSLQDIQ
jgi:hypothetical protein